MKVIVFTSLFPNHLSPNSAVFIKQRMFHFARLNDCEIRVVAPIPYCPRWSCFSNRYTYSLINSYETMEGIKVYHPRYPLIPKMGMLLHGFGLYLGCLRTMKLVHSEFPFDLIDGHYIYPDGFAAVLYSKLFNKPVVLSARGSDINQFSRFITIRPYLRYSLQSATHLIAVCDALKQMMISLGAESKKVSVVPNGVDIVNFSPLDRTKARASLALPQSSKILISVGSLIPRKGFDLLIRAFAIAVQIEPTARLFILGEGPDRPVLEQQINRMGLSERVALVGEVPNRELRTWYNAADVSCLASSREGWANVIMESLACGTPVVASNVWGAPEILTSEEVGMLVERTPQSLSNALSRALNTNWDRRKIREHVIEKTWDSVALQVNSVFTAALSCSST